MTIQKKGLIALGMVILMMAMGWALVNPANMPVRRSVLKTGQFGGGITVAKPWFASRGLVLVFADGQQFSPDKLAATIAATGAAVAVLDAATAIRTFSDQGKHCLAADRIAGPLQRLAAWAGADAAEHKIIAGIGTGGLLAFLASTSPGADTDNLSVGFSVDLPDAVQICPPLTVSKQQDKAVLAVPSGLQIHWRSVWTDYPPSDTAVFVRALPSAETVIAPYDTPLDVVAVKEIGRMLGKNDPLSPNLPIVEVPAATKAKSTVTLFYSGDGGWRDLDRSVAEEMAKFGYPVAGVDVLRYFWEHKSPEQAAADLTKALVFYRKKWAATAFVLAGYSFGADIIPAVFNRLSAQDQASIPLLVLLAPAEQADFEIHVSGWLGHDGGERPLAPELVLIPKNKLLCVYGQEEKDERGCAGLANSGADILELPGGHHFDEDYPKLTRQILAAYHQHGIE